MNFQDKLSMARWVKYGNGGEEYGDSDGPLIQFLAEYEEAVARDQALDRARERTLRRRLENQGTTDEDTDSEDEVFGPVHNTPIKADDDDTDTLKADDDDAADNDTLKADDDEDAADNDEDNDVDDTEPMCNEIHMHSDLKPPVQIAVNLKL